MKDRQLVLFETKESIDYYTFYYDDIFIVFLIGVAKLKVGG